MSIPPLVCSTPPPPDQCEDDKDHEDFDLRYSLSQDDDDNNEFDFGNYSSYSHFQSHTSAKQIEVKANIDENVVSKSNGPDSDDSNKETKISSDDDKIVENVGGNKCEEDVNIEDLNLKLDEVSLNSNIKETDDDIKFEINNSGKENITDIPDITSDISEEQRSHHLSSSSPSEEDVIESSSHPTVKSEIFVDEIIDQQQNSEINMNDNMTDPDNIENNLESCIKQLNEVPKENITDEFDDFEDFQFSSAAENKQENVIENCENPWHNKVDETNFGDFTANFEEIETVNQHSFEIEHISAHSKFENHTQPFSPDDDDFGDFDDFQSSAVNETTEFTCADSDSCQQVPVFNLQSSENDLQLLESINNVLYSIFEHEIPEPENEFEIKLESILSETWGHLMETDVRQPYIVHWNNSFGQKTLLKALCIDSRNILFGPKWTHNMPKYAANLGMAPLQPQKQQTSSNASQPEVLTSDKSIKMSTWTDSFNAQGQDSCNTGSESSVTASSRPTDLDVFAAAMSEKPEKIYSSTLSVQPLRQINLPDTHIFTPTDSETPRSKTIHYDCGPTVLLPQPVAEDHCNPTENISTQSASNIVTNVEDDEYWEFQDFKTIANVNNLSNVASQPAQFVNQTELTATPASSDEPSKPTVTYQTQILQPIKMESIMPTLNWPDPGEVKEVYDDFSDYVSKLSWTNDQHVLKSDEDTNKSITAHNKLDNHIKKYEEPKEEDIVETSIGNGLEDDEFESFQSALPTTNNITVDFNTNNLSSNISNISLQSNPQPSLTQIADFDNAFPKISNLKSDTISFANAIRPNETLAQNIGFISNNTELTSKSSQSTGAQLHNDLLQPVPAGSLTQNKQKTGQILQPLTLESYSQINWPSPGIDLQDLSRFNPVETLQSLKSDLSVSGHNKSSPIHNQKVVNNQASDEDVWGEFVSIKPKQQQPPKKPPTFGDDDEWTEFVSSPSVKPQNGLNTISLNVHTNLNMQKNTNQSKFSGKNNQSLDIPTLNYITPNMNNHKTFTDRHFQNL